MKPSLESILQEAVCFEADAFDDDQQISGAELMAWFADWRQRARVAVRSASLVAIQRERFQRHLAGALHALRDGCDGELKDALDNGGIQITDGEFRVMVFKRTAKEAPCQRR